MMIKTKNSLLPNMLGPAILSTCIIATLLGFPSVGHPQSSSADAASTSTTHSGSEARNQKILQQFSLIPGTSQYQIGDRWLNRYFSDPDVQRSFEISRAARIASPDKPVPGFMDGLARATPQDRYDFFSLVSSMMDRIPIDQCNSDSVTNVGRWLAASHLSDVETETFFRVMFDARQALGQSLPKAHVTKQQVQDAELALAANLDRTYPVGTPLRTRYRNAATYPQQTSQADLCWFGQVSLHLVLGLDPVSRDVILLADEMSEAPE